MITDNLGDTVRSVKSKILEAESLLKTEKQKRIHWYASPGLCVTDKFGKVVPNLDKVGKIPLAARLDGGKWITFQNSVDGKMSGKDFKEALKIYIRDKSVRMIEVTELSGKFNVVVVERGKTWLNGR